MSITGYRLGEGLVEQRDGVAAPQKMVGTELFSKNPPYRASPAANDPENLRRQTVPLLRLRPSSIMRSFEPRPQGEIGNWKLFTASRQTGPEAIYRATMSSHTRLMRKSAPGLFD
jgi:hypothetical protein